MRVLCTVVVLGFIGYASAVSGQEQPNVLLIYADDIGRGDLGVWGQTHFATPHLDRLAGEGMRFDRFYGCTVCATARAALLTGNTNARAPRPNVGGLEIRLAAGLISQEEFDERVQQRRSQRPGEYFMGEMAQSAGYHTAYFGKLGIGYTETAEWIEAYGFDEHCGLYDSVICWGFYPEYYWENGEKISLPTNPRFTKAFPRCPLVGEEDMVYSEDLWLEKCKAYLRTRAEEAQPFLAIYATQLPHGPASIAPKDYVHRHQLDWTPKERVYASMMEKLDRSVGELLTTLEAVGLAENTIVIFMGDNGHEPDSYTKYDAEGMRNGFWDGHQRGEDRFDGTLGQRGVKRSNHEGGLNVPFLIRWPDQVEAGSLQNRRTTVYDLLPTLADVLDVDIPVEIDGLSFLPTLTGEGIQKEHESLFWINSTGASKEAIIVGDWKLIWELGREKSDAQANRRMYRPALYNLGEDGREQYDLSQQMPERTEKLQQMIKDWLKTVN